MHQEVVETWHPVWRVLRGLRDISKHCNGYVWASKRTAPDCVAQQVLSRLRQPVTGTAKTMVSDALQQHCYSTRILDNILKYKRENLALQNVSVLEDLSEAEGQEIPEELSDCELPHSAENCNGQKTPRGSIAFKKL